MFDRRGENRVRRIEVAVGQAVSHAGDLSPRQVGLVGEQFRGQRFHSFADLSISRTRTASKTSESLKSPRVR